MTTDELRALLEGRRDRDFVDREILDRRPWIFRSDNEFDSWRGEVAREIGISPADIRIVGSAATGFSLSPYKAGRPFRPIRRGNGKSSDIDVALLDAALFEAAWNEILLIDRARQMGGTYESRSKTRVDVYWGVVSPFSVPQNTNPSRRLLLAAAALGRLPPIRGYQVRCRLYRRMDDLREYHINSLRQLRVELAVH